MNDSNLKKYKQLILESVNGKYDGATNRILKDIGIDDEGNEEELNEEVLHKFGSLQKDV